MTGSDDIDIREAARLAGLYGNRAGQRFYRTNRTLSGQEKVPEAEDYLSSPSNQPGAEATAALDAMLGASRRGKRVQSTK